MSGQVRAVDPKTGRLYRFLRSSKLPAHATTQTTAHPELSQPPQALGTAHFDNLALLPANLLPFKAEYQVIANQQVPGTTLVVLPIGNSLPRRALEQVVTRMQARGQPVMVIQAAEHRDSGHSRREP